MNITEQTITRFWSKVDKNGDCWVWTGSRFTDGYGQFTVAPRNVRAHRFSWVVSHGAIPDGLCVCHKCDNPACVRPDHLFLATSQENTQDKVNKSRQARGLRISGNQLNLVTGAGHHSAKLTPTQVREIRAAIEEGTTNTVLGRRYGVSGAAIRAIRNRKNWAHVSD